MTAPSSPAMNVTGTIAGTAWCRYCGGYQAHLMSVCPRIEEIEYFPDGTVKRVKLRATR